MLFWKSALCLEVAVSVLQDNVFDYRITLIVTDTVHCMPGHYCNNNNNNNNGRNGSCLTWLATSEERRRWPVISASPRGQCFK